MFLFLKKKQEEEGKATAAAPEFIPLSEFIPYSCHYNHNTLLTKNGELMQIIKIAANNRGLNYESGNQDDATLRENLRKAITETIRDDNFALWIHTLRKRSNIHYTPRFKEALPSHVQQSWQQKHRWKHQYYNEIYVTILHEGQDAKLTDSPNLSKILLPKRNREFRDRYLEDAHGRLDAAVTDILRTISPYYTAHRLGLNERIPTSGPATQAVFYSEPLEFLGTLLNLRSESFPLPEEDLSTAISTTTPVFGFNAIETKNAEGKRRFGAILSLKHFIEVPAETADRVLQAPIELIVSQSFNFIPAKQALKDYKEQKQVFTTSGDQYCIKATGLDEMIRSNTNSKSDYGEHQTTIMVLVDEYRDLDAEVQRVQAAFSALGLITIREDIKLEECFWSQLPGNFEFIRRKDTLNTRRIAGLCRLNRFPNGDNRNTHWGEAVSLIPTMVNSPYFFNFHYQDNGHTAFFDYNSFNDHAGDVLLNFLLTTTRKFDTRLFIFDRRQSSELFFDKLDGQYHHLPPSVEDPSPLRLSPFSLEDNKRNRSFLLAWLGGLLAPMRAVSEQDKEHLRAAIDRIYMEAPESRHLPYFLNLLRADHPDLAAAFAPWHGGTFSGLLDGTTETLDFKQKLHAFDMDYIIKHKECVIPVFSYLLHRIITELDGRPTIIVLHDAWDLLENEFFAPRLESLMHMLKEHNAMLIFTTRTPGAHNGTQTLNTIMKQCATRIYVPDDIAFEYASENLGLQEYEEHLLLRMERQKGDFLLQQNNETIPLRISMDGMDDVKSIYANDIKNLMGAGGKFATLPKSK